MKEYILISGEWVKLLRINRSSVMYRDRFGKIRTNFKKNVEGWKLDV